jgi:hypothetical protein
MDPREAKRIEKEMAEKALKQEPQLIEVRNDFEILSHEIYEKRLREEIMKSDNSRVAPPKGMRWKRTPFDELDESGFFNKIENVISEFIMILNKQSKLSSRKRSFISSICQRAYYDVRKQFKVVK